MQELFQWVFIMLSCYTFMTYFLVKLYEPVVAIKVFSISGFVSTHICPINFI